MYRFSFILLFIVLPCVVFAQMDTTYFNIHWKKTTKDSAHYYRIAQIQSDGRYLVQDHFLNNQVQMTAYATCPLFEDCKTDWATYYDSLGNKTATIHWENGKKNGLSVKFNPYIQDTIDVGEYINDKRTGEWRHYYKDGTIAAVKHYLDGKENGLSTYYDSSTHEKYQETNYHNGMINGAIHRFYPHARTASIIDYKNDTLDGDAITYYREGGISHYESYANGLLLKRVCYDEDGRLIDGMPLHFFNRGKNDTTYFLNNEQESKPKDADYYRVVFTATKDPEMKIEERYAPNNRLKMATYTRNFYSLEYDSSYVTFTDKGDTLDAGAYDKGMGKGEWRHFYPGTHSLRSIVIPKGDNIHECTSYYRSGKVKRYIPNLIFPNNGMCYDEDGTQIECTPYFKPPKSAVDISQFLEENLKYPEKARLHGIQGRVIIKFVVSDDGSISNLHVVHGIGGGCDEEAMRVLSLMPKWEPGMTDDEPIQTFFTLPIAFKLTDK